MPKLPLFDLHCDTVYECIKQNRHLDDNDLSLSLSRLRGYPKFCQILALWTDWRWTEDTAWKRFLSARAWLSRELERQSDVQLCRTEAELSVCEAANKNAVFLAVEGGRLLSGELSRVDALYRADVRFLTLVWNGVSQIGGAHDTDVGLSDFGRQVVTRCHTLGIIPDLSHASDRMTDEVLALCEEKGKVCVATHSNSRAVCRHPRNLTDERFLRICKLGGIVGISLAPQHLNASGEASLLDVVRHIEHDLALGGERTVCLGCDLDGVEKLPSDVKTVSDLYKLANLLGQIGYTDDCIERIFYANARNFISLWLN